MTQACSRLVKTVLVAALFAIGGAAAQSSATEHAGHSSHAAHSAHAGHANHASHADHGSHMDHADHSSHADHADHADHMNHASPGKEAEHAVVRLADVALVDHDGRPQRLKSDVLGDDIVVIDFVYTSCTTVCPVVSAIMGEVQTRLAARLGDDLRLVSLTVDPARDTPARLKEYARWHGAGAGWTWLTGSQTAVAAALKGFGTWTPDFKDHPVVLMVGDARSGEWTRFYGFADPERIVARVDELVAARLAMAKTASSE